MEQIRVKTASFVDDKNEKVPYDVAIDQILDK